MKPKKCKHCHAEFTPLRPMQKACGWQCAQALAQSIRERKEAGERRQERRQVKEKLDSFKSLSALRKEAQEVFNKFIRARDRKAGYGCICCGAPLEWESTMPGGKVDAGHYLSRGSSPEKAFDERNVNAQRKSCNRPGGTTREAFRAGMIARWGLALVEDLERPREPEQLRAEDYRQLKKDYRQKLRELERG